MIHQPTRWNGRAHEYQIIGELVGSSEGERATWEMLSDDDGAFLISTLSREEPEGGEQVGELYTVEVRGEKLLSYNYYYGILLEAATAIVW